MLQKLCSFFIICFACEYHPLNAQCVSGGTDMGNITPTTIWQTAPVEAGQYFTFTADFCNRYYFSFCQGGGNSPYDTEITITDNFGNPVPGLYDNNSCGISSQLIYVPYTSGTFRVYITLYNCITSGGTGSIIGYKNELIYTANPHYILVNSATSAPPFFCVTLTPDVPDVSGCAWDANSTLNFGANFSYDFTVNLGTHNNSGADGMCFIIQNDPRGRCAFGDWGGEMGASGIINSLIVEIDTYINSRDRDDGMPGVLCSGTPDPDHIDIWTNGVINPSGGACPGSPGARVIPVAKRLMSGASLYNIENGADHLLRVSWDFTSSTFTAQVYNSSGSTLYATVSHSFNPITLFGTLTPYFGFVAATGVYTNTQSFCSPAVLLPIELLLFEGKAVGKKNVLEWKTATELNNDFFLIQRSKNDRDFETIGRVEGAGNSNEPIEYSFTDEQPFTNKNYYRLVQNDFDGKFSYSKIIVLKNSSIPFSELVVYPNPASKFISLVADGEIENAQIEIENIFGRIILSQPYKNNIDVSALNSGVYFLRLKKENEIYITKFVKK